MEDSKTRKLKISKLILILLPIILILGVKFGDRNYWLISMLVIIIAIGQFFSLFEKRKPKAREIVPIAIISAIAAVGRFAFAMLPQFKPVAAVVIITGIAFGSEVGFLTGAISALVSNFFFGQGPWTPWQMFAFGIIGYLAGILYKHNIIKGKLSICIYGGFSGYLYGLIVNLWSIFSYGEIISRQLIISTYISSIPFDTIHALSTVLFLYILAIPIKTKMERVKMKYGLFL